jgi:AraC family transcriptional regulator
MASGFSAITLGERLRTAEAGAFALTETAHDPLRALPRHCHEHANVALVLSGSFTEIFDRRSFECRAHDLIVKPPGERHANRYGEAGMRCVVIEVASERLESEYAVTRAFERAEHIRGGPLAALALRAYGELRTMDASSPLAIEGLLLEWIAEASRRDGPRERRAAPWLERAREYLDEEEAERHGLAALAREVGVHPTHLAREFRRAFGCTVGEYVRERRIEQACRLLAESDALLFEIAARVGFADHSHFARTFRRRIGMTPLEYRRMVRPR